MSEYSRHLQKNRVAQTSRGEIMLLEMALVLRVNTTLQPNAG